MTTSCQGGISKNQSRATYIATRHPDETLVVPNKFLILLEMEKGTLVVFGESSLTKPFRWGWFYSNPLFLFSSIHQVYSPNLIFVLFLSLAAEEDGVVGAGRGRSSPSGYGTRTSKLETGTVLQIIKYLLII